jgi:phosphoribosylglycinamide formyltransferase-1
VSGPERLAVGVLVSGGGTNLQALIDKVHGREAQIVGVVSNVAGVEALARAQRAGIETAVFESRPGEDRSDRDDRIAAWLAERGVRLVVLAGYMQLLSARFLAGFPDAVINVHPSLLPAFPGLESIEQAVAYGVRVFGVTVHFVDAGVDSGPVILQRAVEPTDASDPAVVLEALRPVEHDLLPEAVRLFARGALRRDPLNPRRVLVDEYAR